MGAWEGGGVGRWWGAGARGSVPCLAACLGWGVLARAGVFHSIAVAASVRGLMLRAGRQTHLPSGVWKDQHAEIVLP